MGYLKQRKKEKLNDIVLKLLLIGIFVFLTASFFGSGEGLFYYLTALRFHYYIISFLAFLYCLYLRHFKYAAAFMALFLGSFVSLGYSSQIFFNSESIGKENISIFYVSDIGKKSAEKVLKQAEESKVDFASVDDVIYSNKHLNKEGIIHLSNNHKAYFVNSEIDNKNIVLVSVNFADINENDHKIVFKNLTEFVKLQEDPVIIFGDFGIVAWSKTFVKFLNKTSLEVKNRIILSDGKYRFNPFNLPTINLVGYKKMGLNNIKFLPKNKNKKHPLLFKINF